MIEARPAIYVRVHHAIIKAIESCLPVHAVHSIDEVSCRLAPREAEPSAGVELARRIKQTIRDQVGSCLSCSIGLAPNRLLGKLAADLRKPDGLVALTEQDLPHAIHSLRLDDLAGIGPRMLKRLNSHGVATIAQLYQLSESQMREVWGGVIGQRWWHWLRGVDLPEAPTHRSTVGHSHVLPPELRTEDGARAVLMRLLHKVAARLRCINYWAGRMEVYVSYTFREEGWRGSVALGMCQDTLSMIEAFEALWRWRPRGDRPTQVAITLYELTPNRSATLPLFGVEQRRIDLSRTIDRLNRQFGSDMIYFGGMHGMTQTAPLRIAFTQIPDLPYKAVESCLVLSPQQQTT